MIEKMGASAEAQALRRCLNEPLFTDQARRFAPDLPLEQTGFEPSVPPRGLPDRALPARELRWHAHALLAVEPGVAAAAIDAIRTGGTPASRVHPAERIVRAGQIREWIMQSTDRVNILLPAGLGRMLLSRVEAFLIVRLKPRYEGGKR